MREAEDDAVDPTQMGNEGRDLLLRIPGLKVAAPLRLGHDGRKTLPIEIGCDHLVAVPDRFDDRPEQRVIVTIHERMAMNDLD
jgi:hypothetical protein